MEESQNDKVMLALAFAANAGFKSQFVNDYTSSVTSYKAILTALEDVNSNAGTEWNVVWGPALFSFPGTKKGTFIDNQVYVARNGSGNQYAIAIAGTDANSFYDWMYEDFLVDTMVEWPFTSYPELGKTSPKETETEAQTIRLPDPPKISLGTFLGLSILLNLQVASAPASGGSTQLPGAGLPLLPFLKSIAADQPIEVCTTGHSLGGALSPTLALALTDLSSQWDPQQKSSVSAYSFAGPTPGNFNFAAYLRWRVPNLTRIWNGLDVVPHAWDEAHLKEIPTLYGSTAPPDVKTEVEKVMFALGEKDYAPLNDAAATFFGPLQPPLGSSADAQFENQAIWQHIFAYLEWYQIKGWLPADLFPTIPPQST